MQVRTTRFGKIDIAEDRVIVFNEGLLGFSDYHRFCLLEPIENACFFWLQSVEEPSLAFVITDPALFVQDYSVTLRDEQRQALKIRADGDVQIFVIVNKHGQKLTGNLQGPLIVNTVDKLGDQLVLADKRWTTRHTLATIGDASTVMPAAVSA